jgi:hypothetical protein
MPFFLENTAPARLFLVALVRSTASSIDDTGLTASVGPNVSSVISVESSGTCVRMVGCTYRSPTPSGPPSTTVAPFATASSRWPLMTSIWDGIVIGPMFPPSSKPGRTA